uniref:HNH endonuclease signature motif containing protein n=1 Tax=Nocardioides sp. TaxID=35761 RepID=UPI003569AD0A
VPDRIREQSVLLNPTCVFPWCTRSARGCDSDHIQPYDAGGSTASDNIAPLCRSHHRLKTHGGWRYTRLDPGSFLWNSPHGYTYVRDATGTADVSRDRRPPPAHPPEPLAYGRP